MSDIVIKAEGLGKKYLIGHQSERERYTALRDVLSRNVKSVLNKTRQVLSGQQLLAGDTIEEFWALKDIDFEIKRGDRVGIIGRNGAGKSTLLKVLSRITEPSAGRVEIHGRVASLLEVGTGFHPELTGRENIYLNGAILGMTRVEIKKKFDEIVDFAGVEKFLDTPVKRYSSGMYVRLAFAVAAHLEPEILVVDEVLAVGDAEFQKKCLGKMEDVSKNEGRTVLFVSHNLTAISQLTNSGLFLSNGKLLYIGDTEQAIDSYLNGSNVFQDTSYYDTSKLVRKYKGTEDSKIIGLRFKKEVPFFDFGEPISFILETLSIRNLFESRVSFTIFSLDGTPVGSGFSENLLNLSGERTENWEIIVQEQSLAPGRYYFGVSIGTGDHTTGHIDYDVVLDVLHFDVKPQESEEGTIAYWHSGWGHLIFPDTKIKKTAI